MPLLYLLVALIIVAAAWLVNTYVSIPGNIGPILNVVLALIMVGMFLWLINTYIPMAGSIKVILNAVVVSATCVRVLQAVGLWGRAASIWNSLTKHRSSR
ncbi:MAG TPA: Thivi_2564 family membrane protein [Candidatus Solibacter sp.]|nr:Thivi_2564 family membrane protein [Candidatus Solibacter sp.]